jgi:hypothetical protein
MLLLAAKKCGAKNSIQQHHNQKPYQNQNKLTLKHIFLNTVFIKTT